MDQSTLFIITLRFNSKSTAAQAIVSMNGADVNGFTIKCSWGKEPTSNSTDSPLQATFSFLPQSVSSMLKCSLVFIVGFVSVVIFFVGRCVCCLKFGYLL